MAETVILKLKQWIEIFSYIFHHLSWFYIAVFLMGFLSITVFIYSFIISPLIFRFYIIPGIEKKVGVRLEYHPYLKIVPYAKRDVEIATYIIKIYRDYKKLNYSGLPVGCDRFSLKKVGYTIKMVSKAEVFFSWMVLKITDMGLLCIFVWAGLAVIHKN